MDFHIDLLEALHRNLPYLLPVIMSFSRDEEIPVCIAFSCLIFQLQTLAVGCH